MRHLLICLSVVLASACKTPPAPVTEGMQLVYSISVPDKESANATFEFESTDDGWAVTPITDKGTGTPAVVNEALVDARGEPLRMMMAPLWLPAGKRGAGSSYAEMSIHGEKDWNGRAVIHAPLGPATMYYDPRTGFLVGFNMVGGVKVRLIESTAADLQP